MQFLLSFALLFWRGQTLLSVVKYIAKKAVDKMAKITTAIMSTTSSFENESRDDILYLLDFTLGYPVEVRVAAEKLAD